MTVLGIRNYDHYDTSERVKRILKLVNDCASGIRNYDHYDTSKRVKRILKLDK